LYLAPLSDYNFGKQGAGLMEDSSETVEKPVKRKLRWYEPTPCRLFVALLVVEAILLLTEKWFPKGWPVVIAITSVGVTLILLLL
jgi:hypothetical protein